MALVSEFGEMWARNTQNIKDVPGSKEGGQGVYVLYDGSMPMYVGMGNIRSRLRGARRSKSRGQMWDHFSWYIPRKSEHAHDIEALLLRTLPFYLRVLNRQSGKLEGAKKVRRSREHQVAEFISRTKPKKKRRAR